MDGYTFSFFFPLSPCLRTGCSSESPDLFPSIGREMGGGKQLLFIECPLVLALCQVLGNMALWEEKEQRDRRRWSHPALPVTMWLQGSSDPL